MFGGSFVSSPFFAKHEKHLLTSAYVIVRQELFGS